MCSLTIECVLSYYRMCSLTIEILKSQHRVLFQHTVAVEGTVKNVRLECGSRRSSLVRTPYMYALYVRLICTPYMYAQNVCLPRLCVEAS